MQHVMDEKKTDRSFKAGVPEDKNDRIICKNL